MITKLESKKTNTNTIDSNNVIQNYITYLEYIKKLIKYKMSLNVIRSIPYHDNYAKC